MFGVNFTYLHIAIVAFALAAICVVFLIIWPSPRPVPPPQHYDLFECMADLASTQAVKENVTVDLYQEQTQDLCFWREVRKMRTMDYELGYDALHEIEDYCWKEVTNVPTE